MGFLSDVASGLGGAVTGLSSFTGGVAGDAGQSVVGMIQDTRRARREAEDLAAAQREALAKLAAEKAKVIPMADDEAVMRARRRSISMQLRRRGRASTILTNPDSGSDVLGA